MMRIALFTRDGWTVVNEPTPVPGPEQILLEVRACGICASELAILDADQDLPLRLGHEPAGVVAAVGSGVTTIRPGDRVTGRCAPSFAEYVVAGEFDVAKVPDTMPFHLALGEPLACLVEAERRCRVAMGVSVAVVGLGFMGLAFTRLLRLRGVGRLVGIDPRADARAAALQAGANAMYSPNEVPDDLRLTRYEDWPGPRGVDLAIEASGTEAGLTLASELVRAHGTLGILASHGERSVNVGMWNWKAIDVVNAHVRDPRRLRESLLAGIKLLERGQFDFEPLITHRYPLEDISHAFGDLRAKPPGFIKAVVDIGGRAY